MTSKVNKWTFRIESYRSLEQFNMLVDGWMADGWKMHSWQYYPAGESILVVMWYRYASS